MTERVHQVFDAEEVREVLRDSFYAPDPPPPRRSAKKPKPDHYEIICISLYKEDLARLDAKVQELKLRGHRKMSRSALIRAALDQVDLAAVARGY